MKITSVRHLTKGLIGAVMLSAAVLLCLKTPIAAEGPRQPDGATGRLNNAQLTLLFSGSKVQATSDCQSDNYWGELTLDFVFKDDGSFSVDWVCDTMYSPLLGGDKGTLQVEGEDLCLKFEGTSLDHYINSSYDCWTVRREKNPFNPEKEQFSLYGGSDKIWDLEFSHPKFDSKEKLLAALDTLASEATAENGTTGRQTVSTSRAVTLPPAEYKAPPVGTKIKYDDRIYRVTKTDGYLTVYRSTTEDGLSYLNAYALFGEYADNLYVIHDRSEEVELDLDSDSKKKLEAFWPLKVGKKVRFNLSENTLSGMYGAAYIDKWTVALDVAKTESIVLKGKKYDTYVIGETGKSDTGKSYSGRKWYHPATGLIIKAERTWTKAFPIREGIAGINPRFAEGETDNYTLVRVKFPQGAVPIAEKQEPKTLPTVSATDSAPKASVAELARLKHEAEEKRQAAARKAEAEQKAREVEVARLTREEEKAREAEKKAGTAAQKEIARLKLWAVEAQKEIAAARAREADARAREAETARARDAEFARLRQQLEEALKAQKITAASKAKPKAADSLAGIKFGNYHALVIGINNYKYLPKLTTAINDAKGVAKVLKDEYGFKVTTLIDPDRLDIIDAFDELREMLGPKDNLLIYYAGHGWLDEDADQGYWLPVNAKKNRRGRWMSNATITDNLKALSAKHVMVVADSCYSGTLVRGAAITTRKRMGDYWKEMAGKWARVAITSGGLEPVADKGGSGHSPFAKAFIDALRDNVSIMDGMQLFGKMRRPVMVASEQTPQYSDVRQAGHDGGDFLFVRK